MRYILFRGMTDDGSWVYRLLSTPHFGVYAGKTFISNRLGSPFASNVKRETVGQATGLRDKNGDMIFEGDVVDCSLSFRSGILPHRGVIVYDESRGAFATKNEGGVTFLYNHISSSFEIIGNIHENKDLMGGGDENKSS